MSEPTPSEVLAALGEPITLADGSTVRLRYSFRSIAMLEAKFGSLLAVNSTLTAAYRALNDPKASSAKVYTTLLDVIVPGLIDTRYPHPDTGQPVRLGEHPDLVADLLEPAQLSSYTRAFGKAIRQAFGQLYGAPTGDDADPPQENQGTETASPGTSTTTSPSSSPVAATDSSGT